MIFTDYFFLVLFFPVFLITYLLVYKTIPLANIIIVLFSLLFYASFGLENLPILLVPLVLDFFVGLIIFKIKRKSIKKYVLITAIFFNLGLLAYYKYTGFFINNLSLFLFWDISQYKIFQNVVAPIGISFITFQRISYIVDIYRTKIEPTRNFLNYFTYASLFPHLISGPIVRFSQIKDQLSQRTLNTNKIFDGSKYFVFGMLFKVLIANQLFILEEALIKDMMNSNFIQSFLLMLIFSFRIYFDFLGYSFIAVGLAKYMGFDFPINFNAPYQATSITDFWRRWNITLSTWLRDYLYVPLGGNRKGKIRTYINLFFTMLLGGLWHGASWNFIIWGFMHGTFLVMERFFIDTKFKYVFPAILSRIYSFIIINLLWIIFRFPNNQDIQILFSSLLNFKVESFNSEIINALCFSAPAIGVAIIWSFFLNENMIKDLKPRVPVAVGLLIAFLFIIAYSLIRKDVPFIYFQF